MLVVMRGKTPSTLEAGAAERWISQWLETWKLILVDFSLKF